MANDLTAVRNWVDEHGADAGVVLEAGLELIGNLTDRNPDTRPQDRFTGIPEADRAIAEAAGVAAIAGARGVDVDEVVKVAGLLLSVGLTFV